jgi:biopolymer transport protein TolQ
MYNKLSGDLARYAGRLDAFANEFGAILSRQLDERATTTQSAA